MPGGSEFLFLSRIGATTVLEELRRDRERYAALPGGWLRNTGYWIGMTYRFGRWAARFENPFLRLPLRALHLLLNLPWRVFLNVDIEAKRIGPGFCLIHPRNVMIAGGVEIGEGCLIFHEVTLGTNIYDPGTPKIGNNVDIYVGARILGKVTVGDNAMVGANCVVTRDVTPGSVVFVENRVASRAILLFGSRTNGEPSKEKLKEPEARPG